MSKNPFLNGVLASAYIFLVVMIMFTAGKSIPEDNFLAPVAFISTFTLSAAVMGYLFVLTPLELFLTNKKQEGVRFFLKTLGVFAVITSIIFLILFSGLIK